MTGAVGSLKKNKMMQLTAYFKQCSQFGIDRLNVAVNVKK